MDAGLSTYFHPFGMTGAEFAQDLADIGHYYGQYRRLADHWRERSRLRMLEVDYETLVGDPESEARRILEFLDLPWDPACLEFADGAAVHSTSVGRSRHYEPRLRPLLESLAAAGHPVAP